jgi:asparaginyl-tRNA synthetase
LSPKDIAQKNSMNNTHLRIRNQYFGAIMYVVSCLCSAQLFSAEQFHYVNNSIITGSDAEGAGEMFKVTGMDLKNSKDEKRKYKL